MTSPAETTSQHQRDGIVYPVHASGGWIYDPNGLRVAAEYQDSFHEGGVKAFRIAAALNATQHIPTEQLEQVDHKTKRLLPMEVGRTIPIKREGVTFGDLERERAIEAEKAKDVERLRAVNAELLAALVHLLAVSEESGLGIFNAEWEACQKARAAIAEAEELTRG